jgi:hypothetical protein
MQLREAVAKYLELAGGYGRAVPLASFGLSNEETERVFSLFDEDYQISRFLHLSRQQGAEFTINGFPHTHLSIDAEIDSIL